MAHDKWEWSIAHWFILSTRHSFPSPRLPSTIVCRPGKQASSGSRQSLVREVERNVSAMQETLSTRSTMHAQMYFIVSMQIFFLPRQRFKPKRESLFAAWSAEGSTQLVWTQPWHNLTTIRAALMRNSLFTSRRSSLSSLTNLLIIAKALLLLLKLVCNSQLFSLWVGLPSPAAASLSPAAVPTTIATTSQTWPELRIRV